jgi:hypothetical protein
MSFFKKVQNITNSNINREEDYLTEILCFVLNLPDVSKQFVNHFELAQTKKDYKAETQVSISENRIDIVMREEESSSIIFIENKVDSKERSGQIIRYLDNLEKKKNYKRKCLIYLTKYYEDKSHIYDERFKHLRWYEIYKFLDEIKPKDDSSNKIISDFKQFLKDKNMNTPTHFREEHLTIIPKLFEIRSIMESSMADKPYNIFLDLTKTSKCSITLQSDSTYPLFYQSGGIWYGYMVKDEDVFIQVCYEFNYGENEKKEKIMRK